MTPQRLYTAYSLEVPLKIVEYLDEAEDYSAKAYEDFCTLLEQKCCIEVNDYDFSGILYYTVDDQFSDTANDKLKSALEVLENLINQRGSSSIGRVSDLHLEG